MLDYLSHKANGWTDGSSEDSLEDLQVQGTAHVDVGQGDEGGHRVAEYFGGHLLGRAPRHRQPQVLLGHRHSLLNTSRIGSIIT